MQPYPPTYPPTDTIRQPGRLRYPHLEQQEPYQPTDGQYLPPEEEYKPSIVGVPWGVFLAWLNDAWEPGQHLAIIGPTGEGKTTFVVGILGLRQWVIALDPKGEDETLAASGYMRVTSLPLPGYIRQRIAEGQPARLIIGGPSRTDQEKKDLQKLMAQAN